MRIEQLTFTRFIAAFIIIVYHFGLSVYPFNLPSVSFLFSNVGVSYFFVLSGFVMIIAYGTKSNSINPFQYYKNRFARVYPVYLIALCLQVLVMFVSNIPISFWGVCWNIFMIQSWIPAFPLSINRAGWTLSVEVLFYCCFPFLFNKIYLKGNLIIIAIVILTFWLFSQLVSSYFIGRPIYVKALPLSHNFLYYFPLLHLNQFLIGNLFGIICMHVYNRFRFNWDIIILLLLAITTYFLKYPVPFANYHNGFLAILFALIILLMSLNNGYLSTLFNTKFCVFLGEISFGMYILQMPIYQGTYKLTKPLYSNHPDLFFFLFLISLTLSAAISYHWIEKPIRNWIRNL